MAYNFHSIFPYFGSKSKLASLYPAPLHRTIIEPFAGGASYSLLYADHDVWLNDLNPPTAAVWRFLLRKDALTIIRNRIPFSVTPGTTIDQLTKDSDPEGLVWLCRSQFAQSSFGMKGTRTKVAPFGAIAWETFRQRLEYWVPRIAHWKVTMLDYSECIAEKKAVYFTDPPYQNAAGASYAKGSKDIDFEKLGAWCRARDGQVIVAENMGATWLPFEKLTDKRMGIYSDTIKSEVGEVVFYQVDHEQVILKRPEVALPDAGMDEWLGVK
jgi:site-specific DNA-adenine methylase